MTCTISDIAANFDKAGAIVPVVNQPVVITPTLTPLFVSIGGKFYEITAPTLNLITDATTGAWSAVLPWPSESDPSTVQWTITTPDGKVFTGAIPEGIAGPLSLHDLKATYGWALTMTRAMVPLAIQGVKGIDGVSVIPTALKTSAYTAAISDLVRCDPTAAAFPVNLPAASAKAGLVAIKHQSSSANAVTVTPAGADTIDGAAASAMLQAREVLYLCSDGVSDWMVL